MKLTFHWVRHSTSCANVLAIAGLYNDFLTKKDTKPLFNLFYRDSRAMYAPDTLLSDFGIAQAYGSGLFYKQDYKLVLTSDLRRTIETALYFFKGNSKIVIIPVPYIQEIRFPLAVKFNLDLDNVPTTTESLESWLNENYKSSDFPKVDLTLLKEFRKKKLSALSNFDKFIEHVIGKLIDFKKIGNSDKIMIFSHHHFIVNRINTIKKKKLISSISNVEVWQEQITLNKIKNKWTWKSTIEPLMNNLPIPKFSENHLLQNRYYKRCGKIVVDKIKDTLPNNDLSDKLIKEGKEYAFEIDDIIVNKHKKYIESSY
jgi:broad specificity phosphatase PhoE